MRYVTYTTPCSKVLSLRVREFLKNLKYIKPLPGNNGDLKAIANHFKLELYIREKLKFEAAGFADLETESIIMANDTDANSFRRTFCHELSHHIQHRLGVYRLNYKSLTLSTALRDEQEAEVMAYRMCKIFFPSMRFNLKDFDAYYNQNHAEFLLRYYKDQGFDLIKDVTIWQNLKQAA